MEELGGSQQKEERIIVYFISDVTLMWIACVELYQLVCMAMARGNDSNRLLFM